MSQITTVCFFKLEGFVQKCWAFSQMGLAGPKLKNTSGLLFHKIMGSGNGNGFSVRPDFSTYALLCIWENREKADHFFQHHQFIQDYQKKAKSIRLFYLKAFKAHGLWDAVQPFEMNGTFVEGEKIAVLTRARIRTRLLFQFWKSVPDVSSSFDKAPGVLFSKGIGERPFIFQATLSVWENREKMFDFAYRSPKHIEVIKKTRELNWYSEELFAEFEVVESFEL